MSSYQIVPLSGLQRLNAEDLQRAQYEAAYATLHVQADVGALEDVRERSEHEECSVCPYLVRAAALALREFPRLNAQLSSEGLCIYEEVSLGLMVARRDGVLVPTIQQAAQKSPRALASEAAQVMREVYDGQMRRHKTRRPTFTVVDLSRYAVDAFTPILPTRTVGILGAGRVTRHYRPDENNRPRAVPVQTVSLTFDHRAADGIYAARFLSAVVRHLEQPETLRVEAEEAMSEAGG